MFKRPVNITRVKKDDVISDQDVVLVEKPVDIYVNNQSLVNIICLPTNLKELGVGFLFSTGIINSLDDIENIEVDEIDYNIDVQLSEKIAFRHEDLEINPVSRVVETTCGITSPWRDVIKNSLKDGKTMKRKFQSIKIEKEIVYDAIRILQQETKIFRETGGCHGAGVFTFEGELLGIMEDIGRHNAIDKIIGHLLLQRHDFKNILLTSTGRLTGDSVLKAIRAEIPLLASVSAAIDSGIRLAFAYGITLIGFVRGSRMNIYTHPERINL